MASGNKASELAALWLPLHWEDPTGAVGIPVRPGFLYRNQRAGRSPSDIYIQALPGEDRELCPAEIIKIPINKGNRTSGPLVIYSKSREGCLPPYSLNFSAEPSKNPVRAPFQSPRRSRRGLVHCLGQGPNDAGHNKKGILVEFPHFYHEILVSNQRGVGSRSGA